ncbi:D-glycerate dehydrogenase [Aeromicrobium phragmitis]|uniref:D-glycerate dehydrogenase n=1 Tax=Aeromicrobium phragmitis TaxID=2478914 RepID=A0A3L8PHA5_9ACTN|nr:D-glycerate dehydrogenase [Aeromicrobium phragmitis]RLV54555.1 D-glycerate dehydrogenase [Aeromicrobium phragmitis]
MAQVMIIGGDVPADLVARLEAEHDIGYGTHADLRSATPHEGIAAAEAMVLIGQPTIDEAVLQRAPRLKVIALRAVGYDKVDLDACARRGVVVCNTPDVLSRAVADLTVGLLLGALRQLRRGVDHASDGWSQGAPKPPLGSDLRGKTVGIVGFGSIGREVARTCAAGFGMRIAYTSRSGPSTSADFPGPGWLPFEDLLALSDVISLHVPLTPETWHLMDEHAFSQMKAGAYLVNTSRGGLVDEPALIAALRAGHLAGAALDVLANEPPDSDNPLLRMDNVLVTPHIGSATVETRRAMAHLAVDNVLRVLTGAPPATPVTTSPTLTSLERGPQ